MHRDPRILLITDRYFPEVGGSIVWLDQMVRRFPDHTVWIATQKYPGRREYERANPGLSVYRTRLERYRFLKPESLLLYLKLFALSSFIKLRHRVDVLHVSKVLPEGYIARLLKKTFGLPYIIYAHGEEITVFSRNPGYEGQLPRIYNDAAAVIANSSFTREQLLEIGVDERKIVRINPGVDPGMFQPGAKDEELVRRLDLSGKTVLLSVGRLQKRKGHDFVLEALPAALARRPDLVYVILSTGEEEGSLRERARRLGVESAVRFVGEVPYGDLPRYYHTCDVFILANRMLESGDVEGFGIVFLEASACKRPVISGDSGGTRDPVRDGWNGLRIDASSPENITRAILELADDPERRLQMGERGRTMVEEEFSWDRVFEKVSALTHDVVTGAFPPPAEAARETVYSNAEHEA